MGMARQGGKRPSKRQVFAAAGLLIRKETKKGRAKRSGRIKTGYFTSGGMHKKPVEMAEEIQEGVVGKLTNSLVVERGGNPFFIKILAKRGGASEKKRGLGGVGRIGRRHNRRKLANEVCLHRESRESQREKSPKTRNEK